MKELGGKTGVLVGLDLPSAGGETEAGVNPHIGATVLVRGGTFKVRVKQLICGSLNGKRIR